MLNILEPTDHSTHRNKIDSLLRFFKIYQRFELSPKDQSKATFIVAEEEAKGIYRGAIFYPQRVKELHKALSSELLLFLPENQKVWCMRLCFCTSQDDRFSTLKALEVRENFYVDLYEILGGLGKQKRTNCLPITLRSEDYRNSVTYGNWAYFTKVPLSSSSSGYVHTLLSLPDKKRQSHLLKEKEQKEREDFETLFAYNSQNHADRPVQ